MKRRAFIATIVSAAAAVAARRPAPTRLPDWHGITVMRYSFGANAGMRCYGQQVAAPTNYGRVKGVGQQEIVGLPPGMRFASAYTHA